MGAHRAIRRGRPDAYQEAVARRRRDRRRKSSCPSRSTCCMTRMPISSQRKGVFSFLPEYGSSYATLAPDLRERVENARGVTPQKLLARDALADSCRPVSDSEFGASLDALLTAPATSRDCTPPAMRFSLRCGHCCTCRASRSRWDAAPKACRSASRSSDLAWRIGGCWQSSRPLHPRSMSKRGLPGASSGDRSHSPGGCFCWSTCRCGAVGFHPARCCSTGAAGQAATTPAAQPDAARFRQVPNGAQGADSHPAVASPSARCSYAFGIDYRAPALSCPP